MAKLLLNAKFIIKSMICQGLKVGTIIFRKDSRKECKEFRRNLKKKNNIKFLTKLAKKKNSISKANKAKPINIQANKTSLTNSKKPQ